MCDFAHCKQCWSLTYATHGCCSPLWWSVENFKSESVPCGSPRISAIGPCGDAPMTLKPPLVMGTSVQFLTERGTFVALGICVYVVHGVCVINWSASFGTCNIHARKWRHATSGWRNAAEHNNVPNLCYTTMPQQYTYIMHSELIIGSTFKL